MYIIDKENQVKIIKKLPFLIIIGNQLVFCRKNVLRLCKDLEIDCKRIINNYVIIKRF